MNLKIGILAEAYNAVNQGNKRDFTYPNIMVKMKRIKK